MKANTLYKNIFLVTIASSVCLTACNSGNKTGQNNNNDEYVQVQPEKLHFVGSNNTNSSNKSLKDINSDDTLFGFDNIRIGTGINPTTNEVFNSSTPQKEDSFYYYSGDGSQSSLDNKSNYFRPLNVCSGFSLVSSAEENGKVKSTSSDQIFSGEAGVGINLGLAKIKAAASYENEQVNENGDLSIRKDIGAKLNCKVYSYADPQYDSGTIAANNFGKALSNANYDVAQAIATIRNATTLASKQQKIKEFYANFGTHMVSSVDVSDVAASSSIMTQNTSSSSSSQKAAVSASFSYGGFGSADTKFSMATANKFDSKSWNYSINEKYFPSDTSLKDVITDLSSRLAEMNKNGIIDFSKLTPDPAKATLPAAPDLSKITFDDTAFANNKKASLAYASLSQNVPTFNETIAIAANASPSIIKTLSTMLASIESDIALLNGVGATSLTSSSYTNFITNYAAVAKADNISGLKNALANPEDKTTLTTAINDYNNAYSLYSNNSAQIQTSMTKMAADIVAFKTKYPTLKVYFVKYAASQESTTSDKAEAWADTIMAKPDGAIYLKYKAQYDKAVYATTDASQLTIKKVAKTNSLALKAASGNPFGAIYDGHIVTNFNVVPWSRVFPELAQTFTLDDTSEVILEGIDKTIDDFERQYKYLLFSMKMDNTNDSKLSTWLTKDRTLFKTISLLKTNIANTRSNPDSASQSVNFNGINYNISTTDGLAELNNVVANYINSSELYTNADFKNWLNALNTLKQYYLIGNFGSIPAYSVHGGYNNSDKDDSTTIPMASNVETINYNNDAQKTNPIRTILHLVSMSLFNNSPVIAQSYNPGNIEQKSYDSEPYNDDFKNKFNAKYNPDNAISNMIPNNGNPYQIMGIVPVITSNTKITDNGDFISISNIALVDSNGSIWNQNLSRTNALDQFTSNTNLFTLKINKNSGIATINEAKFYEYHWKFGDGDNKSYNNMLLLSHTKTHDDCWGKGDGNYSPTCVQTSSNDQNSQPALQIYNNKFSLPSPFSPIDFFWGQNPQYISDLMNNLLASKFFCRFVQKNSSKDNLINSYFFADSNPAFSAYENANQYFCMEQFLNKNGGYANYDNLNIRGDLFVSNTDKYINIFNEYRDSSEHIPHGLRLIPLSPDLITKIAGKIDGNTQKSPLLPSYYF